MTRNIVRLDDILELQNGHAFKSSEYSESGYFVMRITNVQQGIISKNNPKYIQIDSALKLSKFILSEGDILLSLTGDVGRVGVIQQEHLPAVLNQRVARVSNNNLSKLDNRFLFHYLNSTLFRKQVEDLAQGVAQANVSTKDISQISFHLPPLKEQLHIVAKLDSTYTEIDKIEINIKNQIELSKKLFTKYLNSIFQNSKYKFTKIGDILGVKSGGTPSTTNKSYWNGTIPWYTSRELNDYKTKESVKKITKLGLKNSNAKLFPKNTLLVGIYDTAAMKMSILHQEGTFNQAIVGIPPNSKFDTEYLFFILNYLKDKILLERRGVRQMNLSLAKIKNIDIPMPTLEEQKKIINTCNSFKEQNKDLEKILLKKLNLLNLLKNSIITKELNNKNA